jgi:hypothetical protein
MQNTYEQRGRQAAAAKAVGTTRQRINDWMHGRGHPALEEGLALAEFLRRH